MIQHTDMGMIVMKKEGHSHTSLETGGHVGPHGTDQCQSGGRRRKGRHGPELSLRFSPEGMSETG